MKYPYWATLETVSTLEALEPTWIKLLGSQFPIFRDACLSPSADPVDDYPCPRNCGCFHDIETASDGSLIAHCSCFNPTCPDFHLTPADVRLWELSWQKFARALCKALSLDQRRDTINMPRTIQIGSWRPHPTPVFLSIHNHPYCITADITELHVRLELPFILIGPTDRFINASTLELLHHVRSAYLALSEHLALNPDGTLTCDQSPDQLFKSLLSPHTQNPTITAPAPKPRYAIRKGLGVWYVTIDGMDTVIKHERGMFYVAYLLLHPPEQPIHAIDLMAKIPEIYRNQLALPQIVNSTTGQTMILESHARLQERSLALDDREAIRRLYRKQKELEAILDSDSESEPVKAEALRELEAIVEFQTKHLHRSRDSARTAAKAVRTAIERLHHNLATAVDLDGQPHAALRAFAEHIRKYIITPSGRHAAKGIAHAPTGLAGSFLYEPPPTAHWHPHLPTPPLP